MSVVNEVILLPNGSLGAIFQFILSVAINDGNQIYSSHRPSGEGTYTCTSRSFNSTAMSLLSSFAWRPILPARSSSFKLRTYSIQSALQRRSMPECMIYSHRMPCELVHNNNELGLVECPRDVLHQQAEGLLILFCGHSYIMEGERWQRSVSSNYGTSSPSGCALYEHEG